MIAEGKTERRRRRVLRVMAARSGLMIFFEFFVDAERNDRSNPPSNLWGNPQRNSGIVLDNDATVLKKEIAHPGESIAMQKEGSSLE